MKTKYKKYVKYLVVALVAVVVVLVAMIQPKANKQEALELKNGLEEKITETDNLMADIQTIQADIDKQNEQVTDLTKKIETQKKTVKEHQEYIEKNK